MKKLLGIILAFCVSLPAVAQVLTAPPPFPVNGSTSSTAVLFQPCTTSQGGAGSVSPCGTTVSLNNRAIGGVTATTIFRLNNTGTVPPSATQIILKLLGPPSSSIPIKNICVGANGGTQQYQFSTSAGTCDGTNGCIKLCSTSGANPCPTLTSAGVTLSAVTFGVTSNLLIAIDHTASSASMPTAQLVSSPSGSINYYPGSSILSNQYNTYRKASVQEACSLLKGTSGYGVNFGTTGQNWTAFVSQLKVQ